MGEEEKIFRVQVERLSNYQFKVDFGLEGVDELITDEPEPLGKGNGPNPSRILAAAMGNCLASSLLFCLEKSRVNVNGIKSVVKVRLGRNEKGRWRIVEIDVELTPEVEKDYINQMQRCIELFQDFCIVSKSVEKGIPLNVNVKWPNS